jgi:hypothetical protein
LYDEGIKDEDRAESCDPSLERELEPQLDGADENALGVSVSVSQTGGRK